MRESNMRISLSAAVRFEEKKETHGVDLVDFVLPVIAGKWIITAFVWLKPWKKDMLKAAFKSEPALDTLLSQRECRPGQKSRSSGLDHWPR